MEKTLLLIKPDAVERNLIGAILAHIENKGFIVENIRIEQMGVEKAREFYSVHRGKPFFDGLVDYMISGKTVGIILRRENAVKYLRQVVGCTDPAEADKGTVRHEYGQTLRRNSVHASDCSESAQREINVFFKENQ